MRIKVNSIYRRFWTSRCVLCHWHPRQFNCV